MEGTSPNIEKTQPSPTEACYCRLLEVPEMPQTPEQSPDQFHLGPEFIAPLAESIIQTMTDQKERHQRIYWNAYTNKLQPTKLHVGRHTSEGIAHTMLRNLGNVFLRDKAVISYHTHPYAHEGEIFKWFNAIPSIGDVVNIREFPQEAFIFLIGGRNGISAIVETKQSVKSPSGFFEKNRKELMERLLKQGFSETMQLVEIEEALKQEGLAYYCWQTPYVTRTAGEEGVTLSKPSFLENQPKRTWPRFKVRRRS